MGKTLGQPVHRLLGGRCHSRLRVYADGFFRGADYVASEYAAKAVTAVGQGFTALKMDVDAPIPSTRLLHRDISSRDLDRTVAMVQAVRDAVGDHIDLTIDCHGAFNVSTAIRLGRHLEAFGLMWIENPVPSGNVKAMAKVSQALEIPVCTGELLRTRFEYRALLEDQATDIVMPDVARTGGILELKKIAAAADTYYVPVATMAGLQVCACTPNFLIMEYQLGDVPWRDQIVDPPITLVDGYLQIPSTPGLGVTLQRDALAGHLVKG